LVAQGIKESARTGFFAARCRVISGVVKNKD
jgi:hypothetical protein